MPETSPPPPYDFEDVVRQLRTGPHPELWFEGTVDLTLTHVQALRRLDPLIGKAAEICMLIRLLGGSNTSPHEMKLFEHLGAIEKALMDELQAQDQIGR